MNFRVLAMAVLLVTGFFQTGAAEPEKTFSVNDSYELAELIWWGAGFRDGSLQNIIWDGSPRGICRAGQVGILFGGATDKDGKAWEEGVPAKILLCPPGDGTRLDIIIPMSPLYIEKKLTGKIDIFNLAAYLTARGANVNEVWNKGRSGWGEKLFLLEFQSEAAWISLRTEHGLNGLVGTTRIVVFGKRATAEKDSETEKHY